MTQIMEQQKERRQRGITIAQTQKVVRNGNVWLVPSQTSNKKYEVTLYLDKKVCTCPDYTERQMTCKHIFAVEITISKEFDGKGNVRITQTKRITYPQNWSAYNLSQIKEKEMFVKLLADLCNDVEEPLYAFGRPQLSTKDKVFTSALKVYTTFSLRRFMTDMRSALKEGYITQDCSYSSVSNYMRDAKLTPILQSLITLSAMPLRSVETKFAIDSTGLRTTKFNDYCRETHDTKQAHKWVKVHVCTGIKTNIITAVEVGFENHSADSPQFIPLAERTYENGFNIIEMSADKAYSSRDNMTYIDSIYGMPYIPFKNGATGKSRGSYTWMKMFRFFTYNRDEFLEHYHQRSNVESTMNMIKAKFTDLIRSKDQTAQINEALLKVLCHNICVLISSMFELGIKPEFLGVAEGNSKTIAL